MSQTTTRRLNILAGHLRNAPHNTKQIHPSHSNANEEFIERPKPFRFELPYAYGEEKKQATIALREAVDRIVNIVFQVYTIMEAEEEEEETPENKSQIAQWLSPITNLFVSKKEEPTKTFFQLTSDEIVKAREEILKQPNTPFLATLIVKGAENTFTIVTALSVASLLTTSWLHNIFENKLTPYILYYSILLDHLFRRSFYDIQALRKRYKRFTSKESMDLLQFARSLLKNEKSSNDPSKNH